MSSSNPKFNQPLGSSTSLPLIERSDHVNSTTTRSNSFTSINQPNQQQNQKTPISNQPILPQENHQQDDNSRQSPPNKDSSSSIMSNLAQSNRVQQHKRMCGVAPQRNIISTQMVHYDIKSQRVRSVSGNSTNPSSSSPSPSYKLTTIHQNFPTKSDRSFSDNPTPSQSAIEAQKYKQYTAKGELKNSSFHTSGKRYTPLQQNENSNRQPSNVHLSKYHLELLNSFHQRNSANSSPYHHLQPQQHTVENKSPISLPHSDPSRRKDNSRLPSINPLYNQDDASLYRGSVSSQPLDPSTYYQNFNSVHVPQGGYPQIYRYQPNMMYEPQRQHPQPNNVYNNGSPVYIQDTYSHNQRNYDEQNQEHYQQVNMNKYASRKSTRRPVMYKSMDSNPFNQMPSSSNIHHPNYHYSQLSQQQYQQQQQQLENNENQDDVEMEE